MSDGLSWYIIVIVLFNIFGMLGLIWWSGKGSSKKVAEGEEMGHVWDGDLREYNNPLPRWWLWMFYITIVFGLVYFALYPALGKTKGALGWSKEKAWEQETQKADEKFAAFFQQFEGKDLTALAQDPDAVRAGKHLYLNYCAQCHGSDAGGARGFPDLTDNDWLYGGEPENIKTSVLNGRNGIMPPFGPALGDDGVEQVAAYVMKLAGRQVDESKAQGGQEKFLANCAGCHMPDGTGNKFLGAPNLANNIWLYGGSEGIIQQTIREGRNGVMPAHKDFLGEQKVQLVSAYVLSLAETAKQ